MEYNNNSAQAKSPTKVEPPVPNASIDQLPKELASQNYAAFSLASLDQGNSSRSYGAFDPGMFLLKSGSFDNLQGLLGSQLFRDATSNGENKSFILPPMPTSMSSSNPVAPSSTTNLTLRPPSPSNINVGLSVSALKSILPTHISSNVIATSTPSNAITASQSLYASYGNNALIQPRETEKRIVERKDENSKFVDVTPFLTLPQHEAAKKLGIPSSTLAKRWKEASCNRKWPYRTVSKLDKEILTLLKNVENAKAELSPSVEANLGLLLKKRQEELKTVLVRL
jgi:hypothetical protein